jgi:glutathione S-transferase
MIGESIYKLYYYPGNANLAPHMLLEELGVDYELVLVDRGNNSHKSPEYLKLNPTGRIPVLIDGDLVPFESAAICLHVAVRHPQAALAPVKAHAESRVGAMLDLIENTLADGGPYLLGAHCSAVDPYLLMLSRRTRMMQYPARQRPHLGRYLDLIVSRPAVQRAFAGERLTAPLF